MHAGDSSRDIVASDSCYEMLVLHAAIALYVNQSDGKEYSFTFLLTSLFSVHELMFLCYWYFG